MSGIRTRPFRILTGLLVAGLLLGLIPPATGATKVSPVLTIAEASDDVLYYHRTDGSIWRWEYQRSLTAVNDLPAITELSRGGGRAMMALSVDGSVYDWYDADPDRRPQPIAGLSQIVSIAGGKGHGLALRADGTVWSWGYDDFGQLGTGLEPDGLHHEPAHVADLEHVVAIAAGDTHSLAVTADGQVWAWGSNIFGELGLGYDAAGQATGATLRPTRVPGLGAVTDVAAGSGFSVALDRDGRVWTWGKDFQNQLGDTAGAWAIRLGW